jgi:hypothetical protein
MSVARPHKVHLRSSERLWIIIRILTFVMLLLVPTEFAKAADLIWLSCSYHNARSGKAEAQVQIYALNEKERKLWSYNHAQHQLIIVDNTQIEKELITAWPFRSPKGKGTTARADAYFEQNFVMFINRVTGAYFRGLPGVADTGSCTATQPQPVDDMRTKF